LKFFDLFTENLTIQAEYNQAQPFTYAHKIPEQNNAHYNQPLAHPLGANFREVVGLASYRYKRFYANAKLQIARYGADQDSSHVGKDIFISDFEIQGFPDSYGNEIGQGLKSTLLNAELRVGYLVNPKINLKLELAMALRKLKTDQNSEAAQHISFSVKTDLFNHYYDF
jgi:hypothetical protein